MNLFQQFLRDVMERRGWNQPTLAKQLGVTQSTVSRWLTGASPKMETLTYVVDRLNGQIDLTLNSDQDSGKKSVKRSVPSKASGFSLDIRGEVDSKSSRLERVFPEVPEGKVGPSEELFRDSQAWSVGAGPAIYFRVLGGGLVPGINEDDLLVCQVPHTEFLTDKPSACLVVVSRRSNHEKPWVVRLHAENVEEGGFVIGVPMNENIPVRFLDPDRYVVEYVILGVISPRCF